MKKILRSITHCNLAFSTCILCDSPTQSKSIICRPCTEDLPWLKNSCSRCGRSLQGNSITNVCGSCLQSPPPFDNCIVAFDYAWPIDNFISAIKFNQQLNLASLLGELFSKKIIQHYQTINCKPEIVIPMPLHKKRLRERGFNQAVEITRRINKFFNITIDNKLCVRTKATTPQSSIPAEQRHQNVRHAFDCKSNNYNYVAVLDDVITTGHTMKELCKTLKIQSIEKIDIWCCARTQLKKTNSNSR